MVGRRVIGKESFYQAMEQALEVPLAKILTKIEVADIQFISLEVAIVSCIKYISNQRNILLNNPTPEHPSTGSLSYVFVKNQGKWQIALTQTSPIMQ